MEARNTTIHKTEKQLKTGHSEETKHPLLTCHLLSLEVRTDSRVPKRNALAPTMMEVGPLAASHDASCPKPRSHLHHHFHSRIRSPGTIWQIWSGSKDPIGNEASKGILGPVQRQNGVARVLD